MSWLQKHWLNLWARGSILCYSQKCNFLYSLPSRIFLVEFPESLLEPFPVILSNFLDSRVHIILYFVLEKGLNEVLNLLLGETHLMEFSYPENIVHIICTCKVCLEYDSCYLEHKHRYLKVLTGVAHVSWVTGTPISWKFKNKRNTWLILLLVCLY